MLKMKKHKTLSKLIAFTFAFNAIAPVAFASEDTTTATTTASSGGLSLKSISNDIATRMAITASSNFKSRNLNISDEEINNLLRIPLSTDEEESYLTQEEKDYNALQLLIAKGYNNKEKRQAALEEFARVEQATAQDASVGGLSKTEKYIKQNLESFDEISNRANVSNGISSSITTTDDSISTYKTILKIAKAERLACRNDANAAKAKVDKGETLAEETNTDPDKCELPNKGKEAAQMLTAIANQQVNQTTDSKKTTTATNATTTTSGERKCETSGTTVAINDNTKCCPTQQPFYNSTTAKCVASLSTNTTSNSKNNDDDDDDSTSSSALLQYLMTQQQSCRSGGTGTLYIADPCAVSGGGTKGTVSDQSDESTSDKKKANGTKNSRFDKGIKTKSGTEEANKAIMSRISDIKVEFNENNKDDKGNRVHVADSNSEFKVKVMFEEKETDNEKEQSPLYVKVYATQYVGADKDNSSPYRFTQVAKNGEFVTVVYPENMTPKQGVGHFVKKVLDPKEYYELAITLTDGKNESAPFYVKYRIVTDRNGIVSNDKDQTGTNIVSLMGNQGSPTDSQNVGSATFHITKAEYENGICRLSGKGELKPFHEGDDQEKPISATEYKLSSITEADCAKLNVDAQDKELIMTVKTAEIQRDGFTLESVNSDVLPAFSVDGGATFMNPSDYLSVESTMIHQNKYDFPEKFAVPLGVDSNGQQMIFDGGSVKYLDGKEVMAEQLQGIFETTIPEGANTVVTIDNDGHLVVNLKDKNGNVIASQTTDAMAQKTTQDIKKGSTSIIDAQKITTQMKRIGKAIRGMISDEDWNVTTIGNTTRQSNVSSGKSAEEQVDTSNRENVPNTSPATSPNPHKHYYY